MLDDFVIRAILAGIGLSLATGPLGLLLFLLILLCYPLVTAHAAILGVALALAFSVSIVAGTLFVALIVGLSVSVLAGKGYALDTTLGLLPQP